MLDRTNTTIAVFDPDLWRALEGESRRQEDHIELIASENYASPRVVEAQGSVLTNKYAEGCPGKQITGKEAEAVLGRAHITVNKNAIPNDPQKPFVTSGIRIGSPAMTTRGFKELEAEALAHLIADVLEAPAGETNLERVAGEVKKLCERFPVYAAGAVRRPLTSAAA